MTSTIWNKSTDSARRNMWNSGVYAVVETAHRNRAPEYFCYLNNNFIGMRVTADEAMAFCDSHIGTAK